MYISLPSFKCPKNHSISYSSRDEDQHCWKLWYMFSEIDAQMNCVNFKVFTSDEKNIKKKFTSCG